VIREKSPILAGSDSGIGNASGVITGRLYSRLSWFSMLRAFAYSLLILLCSCGSAPESRGKAFLGALLIDGAGGPPLNNSIVVTASDKIRAAGRRSAIPIPADADRVDGSGKCLLPTPIDACPGAPPQPASPDEARRQVTAAAGRTPAVVYLGTVAPEIADVFLDSARSANVAAVPHISTLAEVRRLLDRGSSGFTGMIADTEDLDPAFLSHLRDLRIAFAPALVRSGTALDVAKRNTRRLFEAGLPIAAATCGGGELSREIELLVDAGLPPLDAIVAATRNSAAMLRQGDLGTIAAGKRADLLLVEGNPGEDIRNLRKVALRMVEGGWVK
jgi:hypothetical protein